VSLRLEGCLITPIQRIPRYKLFLEDLVKHTPSGEPSTFFPFFYLLTSFLISDHPDSPLLKEALRKIEEVANSIEAYLKENEQRLRLIELTSKSGASVRYLS